MFHICCRNYRASFLTLSHLPHTAPCKSNFGKRMNEYTRASKTQGEAVRPTATLRLKAKGWFPVSGIFRAGGTPIVYENVALYLNRNLGFDDF